MFLGANMDAVKEAQSIGISSDWSVNSINTSAGVRGVYDTVLCATSAISADSLDGWTASKAYADATETVNVTIN
jgi:hypothetical protein